MQFNRMMHSIRCCFSHCSFFRSPGFFSFIRPAVMLLSCCLFLTACQTETSVAGTVYELSDLPGKRIGVLTDSQADLYATDLELPSDDQEPSVIVRYQSLDASVEDLKTGTLDCIIMDASSAETYCSENQHLITLDEAFSWQEYSICLGADRTELTETLNQALAVLEENGTLQEISDRYITTENRSSAPEDAGFMEAELSEPEFSADDPETADSDQPPRQTLHAATSSGFQPYTYYDENGTLTGIDIDIARALADYLDMDIQITDMDYESLFTSVADGSADFAIAGISPGEIPAETCIFTDSYTAACQMVLVRE